MPPSPQKARPRVRRQVPLPSATPPRRDSIVDKRDVSGMAVMGTALASALQGGASLTQGTSINVQDETTKTTAEKAAASVASLSPPSNIARPGSTSFGAQQPASSSLQQLDALHQRLQNMLATKADEQQHKDDAGRKQQHPEAISTPRPSNLSDTATSSPVPASTNPLLQRLQALVVQAEQQQWQQPAQSTTAAAIQPTAGRRAAAPVTATSDAPVQAIHPPHAALTDSAQPSPVHATLPPANSHVSADPSASALTTQPLSLPTPAPPSIAPTAAELAHSHLSEQLRQLSECRQQAVAECVAVQARLLAAVAQLHALHAHYEGELSRIEDEYGRAVEQCKAQHSQRVQILHER